MALVDEVMHGKKLDSGDAELLQILDARFAGQAGVGAAQCFRNGFVEFGKATDMDLINDRIRERRLRRTIVLPVKALIDHDRLRHAGRRVLVVADQIVAGRHVVRKDGRFPVHLAGECLRVRIDQQLVGIEAKAGLRLPWPLDAIAVSLARLDVANHAMPHERRALSQRHAVDLVACLVEEANRDSGGVFRKQGKVGSF